MWEAKGSARVAKESNTEERGSVDTHTIVVMYAGEDMHPHGRTAQPLPHGEEKDVAKEGERKRGALQLRCVRTQARLAEGDAGEGTVEAAERWVEGDGRCERAKDGRTHTGTPHAQRPPLMGRGGQQKSAQTKTSEHRGRPFV